MTNQIDKETIPVSQVIIERLTETRAEIAGMRAETKAEIAGLRADTKADIEGLRKENKADIQSINMRIDRMFYIHSAIMATIMGTMLAIFIRDVFF